MKKFLFIILIALVGASPAVALAGAGASMVLQQAPTSVAQQQQFYIDVAVDPQDTDFNGIQGSVEFSSNTLSFVRAETGTSLVSYFIDQPSVQGNMIHFSGIIIGGFDGLINPFDQSHKLPGPIVRLVFEAVQPGNAVVTTSNVSVTENDGNGTLEPVTDTTVSFPVTTAIAPSIYNTADTVPPTLSASIVSSKDLFDGKYTVVFTATDKQSGIDHVELKEGNGAWKTIQSPYVLQDQTRKGILSLRAYDVAGNVTTITLPSTGTTQSAAAIIFLLLAALIILYVIHKKTKHPKHPPL